MFSLAHTHPEAPLGSHAEVAAETRSGRRRHPGRARAGAERDGTVAALGAADGWWKTATTPVRLSAPSPKASSPLRVFLKSITRSRRVMGRARGTRRAGRRQTPSGPRRRQRRR